MKAWISGQFVEWEAAKLSILSPSFGRGIAVFEILDVVQASRRTAVFRLDAHLDRLCASAELLHLTMPYDRDRLRRAVLETVRENNVSRGVVKLFAYYAEPDFGLIPHDPRIAVAMFAADFPTAYGKTQAELAVPCTVGISPYRKLDARTVAVHAKATGNYVNSFLARWDARHKGYDDALLLDCNGLIAEGSLSNVFFVKAGKVLTPRLDSALAGITRDSVIAITTSLELPLQERDITVEEAVSADEVFLTGSTVHVRAVRAIDGQDVGRSCPGPVTARIGSALADAIEGRDARYRQWLSYGE